LVVLVLAQDPVTNDWGTWHRACHLSGFLPVGFPAPSDGWLATKISLSQQHWRI